jgi:5'-nucleotidase
MASGPNILLTNDDGIDSPGLRALYDTLSAVGRVTAVAPADDQSAVGRALSASVDVREHDLGYVVEGTPSDAVVAGIEAIGPTPDIVVSGCNEGANLGEYVLGRSGTISAAVEATFFDIPAIAVSLYVPVGPDEDFAALDTDRADYTEATRATRYLVEHALDGEVFANADYLNVNAPAPGTEPAPMTVTRPSRVHEMDAIREGDTIHLHDRIWDRMADGDIADPSGTDRRAVVEGAVSVSPLTAPHSTEHHEALDDLAAAYHAD